MQIFQSQPGEKIFLPSNEHFRLIFFRRVKRGPGMLEAFLKLFYLEYLSYACCFSL